MTTHWLASRLEALKTHAGHQGRPDGGPIAWSSREQRDAFLAGMRELAAEVANRRGVMACVVAHEGLVIAVGGRPSDSETLAAVTQQCVTAAVDASETAGLGGFEQTLVVGKDFKIAMFGVGGMTLAIQATTGVDLAASLCEPVPTPETP